VASQEVRTSFCSRIISRYPALAGGAPLSASASSTPTHSALRQNSHPHRLRIESSLTIVHSQFTGFKILSVTISNPPDYLAHAPIIDSLTFVMLSLTTTRPTLARSLHQQVLINSGTPSTSALFDSLPQPSTTPTAFGSSYILASFRQPSAAPDTLQAFRQPSAAYAAFSSPRQSPPAYVLSPSTSPSPRSANTEASESSTTGAMTARLTRSDSTARGFSLILSLCYRGLTSEPSLPTNTANTISPSTSPSPRQHVFRWQRSHPSSKMAYRTTRSAHTDRCY